MAKIEVEGGLDEEKTKKIKEKKSKWEASKEKISQEIKKDQSLAIVKKYLDLFKFKQRYTILELARLINKPESLVSKLKKNSFEKLQTAARERNLHSLLE